MERRAEGPDLRMPLLFGAFGLIILVVICYSAAVFVFKADIPKGLDSLLTFLAGAVAGYLNAVYGWAFGSSQSSARKDAIIASTVAPTTDPVDTAK